MRKFWSLTHVLLKGMGASLEVNIGGKRSKWAGPMLWSLVAVCMLPLLFVFYTTFQGLYAVFAPAGELAYITGLMLNMACIVIFIFSAFSAPAIYYFSKDVDYLLPLPLSPVQIIGAKFLVSLLFEYLIALFVVIPMYAVYVAYLPVAALTVNTLLTFLTLPLLPLIYSTVLIMVLMRLSRVGKNRDLYNMVVGLLAIVFGIGVSIMSQNFNTVTPDQVTALIEGNQAALTALKTFFPNNIYAGRAIAEGAFISQAINILITGAAVCVFFLLAQLLYFKGVIGISESSASSKRMTRAELIKNTRSQNALFSCLQKEIRLLFRSPTVFMNCVLMVYLMPVILLISVASSLSRADFDVMAFLSMDISDPRITAGIFVGASVAGFFFSTIDMVTATAISREGSNYYIMKYIPVSYRTQLNAKLASGLVVTLPALVLSLIVLEVLFKAPLLVFLAALVLSVPGCVCLSCLGLLMDLIKPKLVWDNEQMAVKQNLNAVLHMLIGMALTAVVGVAGFIFLKTPVVAFTVLLLITGLPAAGMYYMMVRSGVKILAELNG